MWRPHFGLPLRFSGRLEGQDSRTNNCLKAQLLLFKSTHYEQQEVHGPFKRSELV